MKKRSNLQEKEKSIFGESVWKQMKEGLDGSLEKTWQVTFKALYKSTFPLGFKCQI